MKAIIYTRFSNSKSAEGSHSCQVQEKICRDYCTKQGYDVTECFYDNAVSGADPDRKPLWDAVNATVKNCVLVVFRPDRLARDVYLDECVRRLIKNQGGRLESVEGGGNGTSPEDVFIRQILAAFAEYERKIIALRTKYAMLHHQANGRRMGRYAPYGWVIDPEDNKRLIANDAELQTINFIAQLYEQGVSAIEIATQLRINGIKSRGAKWQVKTIRKIIDRLQ